jgi:hypothetical protein
VFTVEMLITSALRTQIWTTIAVYLLVAVLKKRLHLDASLYTVLQILSLALFEKMPFHRRLLNFPSPHRQVPRKFTNVYLVSKPDSSGEK